MAPDGRGLLRRSQKGETGQTDDLRQRDSKRAAGVIEEIASIEAIISRTARGRCTAMLAAKPPAATDRSPLPAGPPGRRLAAVCRIGMDGAGPSRRAAASPRRPRAAAPAQAVRRELRRPGRYRGLVGADRSGNRSRRGRLAADPHPPRIAESLQRRQRHLRRGAAAARSRRAHCLAGTRHTPRAAGRRDARPRPRARRR